MRQHLWEDSGGSKAPGASYLPPRGHGGDELRLDIVGGSGVASQLPPYKASEAWGEGGDPTEKDWADMQVGGPRARRAVGARWAVT